MRQIQFLVLIIAAFLVFACSVNPVGNTGIKDDSSGRALSLSTSGAFYSGMYRNLFKELGKTDTEIQTKLNLAWTQLFYGDDSTQRIFYPVGTDQAYIKDVGNSDVRSEGMSYGMMICVQMNKQKEFDMLYTWAKNHMFQKTGQFSGYFAWNCDFNGNIKSDTPASDGDEYFAMALFLASGRWGDKGTYNYQADANAILKAMLHQADDNNGWNMFDATTGIVVFCPIGDAATYSDPSYVVPAFYDCWAQWANADRDRWNTIAENARAHLHKAVNARTFLAPDYANFDGSPKAASWDANTVNFRFDAWRVAQNIGVDWLWWAKDSWQQTYADGLQSFFRTKGLATYGNQYQLDGTQISADRSPGLVAINAVASHAATQVNSKDFVQELWSLNIPSGQWRYYDGCLYFLALLEASGNYRVYAPGLAPTASPTATPTLTPTVFPTVTPTSTPHETSTPAPSTTPTITPPPPKNVYRAEIKSYAANAGGNTLAIRLHVKNNGELALPLAGVSIKYYFTKDGLQPLNAVIDHAGGVVNGSYQTLNSKMITSAQAVVPVKTGADTAINFNFATNAPVLLPQESFEIQARVYKSDWSNFDLSNDWSTATASSYVVNAKIPTVYNGTVIWGTNP